MSAYSSQTHTYILMDCTVESNLGFRVLPKETLNHWLSDKRTTPFTSWPSAVKKLYTLLLVVKSLSITFKKYSIRNVLRNKTLYVLQAANFCNILIDPVAQVKFCSPLSLFFVTWCQPVSESKRSHIHFVCVCQVCTVQCLLWPTA